MTWQEWVQNNFKSLKSMSLVYGDLSGDILTHLSLYLDDNWLKFNMIPDSQKLRWIGRWMRNQAGWSNSQVNRDLKTNNLPEDHQFDIVDDQHETITIFAEDGDDKLKGWISDTFSVYGSDKTDKLIRVKYYYHSLTLPEQILYTLYFDELLTHRAIAQRLNIPLTSSFLMVKELETKLINLCNSTGTQSLS